MTDTSLDLLKRRQQDEPEQAQDASLDILKQRQQQRAQIQKSTMLSATSTNPDQYASELKLADEIKAPVNVVSLAPDEAQRVATENRIRKAEAENPKVTGWAGKGDNAKLAHDDLNRLIDFDNAFVRYLANTGISLRDGLAGIFAPMRDFGTGIVTGAPDIAGKAVESVGTFRDAANQYFSNLSPFALQKQVKQDDFAEGFKDTGQGVQGVAQYLREATGQDRESVPSIAGDTISQVAGFAVAPGAMSSAYFLSSSQQGYEEALQEGANQDQALAKGFLDGLIELGSEKMGTEKILKYIPAPAKDGLIKQALDMLKGSGIEIFEEYAAEVGKQLTSKGIYDPDKEIDFTPLSAEEVTGMGLGISILIGGSRRMQMAAEREQQQAIIDKQKELLTELRDKAEASKTFSRNKKTFQDFVDSINPDEDPNVYIDAQGATEYLQDDAELVFEQLGAGQQYRDAMVTGGDVQVPFSAFVSLEERPYFEALLDDLRYDIGGNTARELRDNQDNTDILQEAQRIVEEGKAQQETLSIGDEVYQNIKDQLGSTGRFNTDIADQYAKLHQAFATTFIERGLATPEQMKRYYNLGIVDQMKDGVDGVTMDQDVWQGSPHKYDGRLDPTKIGTGEGAQAYGYGHYLGGAQETGEFYKNALSKPTELQKLYRERGLLIFKQKQVPTELDKRISELETSGAKADAGYLYKFDLDDNAIANMLDWDAPLSEQPEAVRNAFLDMNQEWLEDSRNMTGVMSRNINDAINDQKSTVHKITGQDIYKQAVRDFGPKEASDLFAQYGSSGIKYYDGSSRAAGEGTRNFVVFPGNEHLVIPISRNGEPLTGQTKDKAIEDLKQSFDESQALFQQDQAERQSAEAKGLPMDQESRMQRDRDMGFDTETVYQVDESGNLSPMTQDQGTGDNSTELDTLQPDGELIDAKTHITSLIDSHEDEYDFFGLRVLNKYDHGKYKAGDVLPPSFVWDDGVISDDLLDGTSAIQIKSSSGEHVELALSDIGAAGKYNRTYSGYSGKQVVLIASNAAEGGNDVNEIIMPDAVVLHVYDKESDTVGEGGGLLPINSNQSQRDTGAGELVYSTNPPNPSKIRSINAAFDPEYSDSANLLFQKTRGSITFPTEGIGNNTTYIKLMEGANLSTFLHESGHFFLEVLKDISAQPDAAPEAVEMMAALTEWFGTDQISREQHEQFARGFEAYLREGKAPSSELQSVFERFMGWLLLVYKKLSQLNVKITPEVRNVMDRMLATDEAITAVEDAAGFQPIFSAASEGGMTDGEYNNYLKGVEKARNDALTDLRAKHISELERGRKDAWRDEKSQIRKDVEQQVARDPVFQVKNALMYGKLPDGTDLPPEYENIKLDRDWLIERYGDKGIWRKLPFGKNSVTSSNGINPETVAEIFGFTSADEMITRMVEAGSMEAEIRQRVNDEMIARHGDMMKEDDSLAREAMGSVSKDSRATQIYTELRMLSRQAGVRPAPIDIIKQAARQQIQAMKAREIQPYRFLRAMQKHSREALKALADGDFQSSLAHKTQQLLNFQLYTEAMKAKDQVDKIQRYLAKFDSPNVRKKLDRDYLDQIDSILESVSLKKSVSNKEIDRRKSFSAWYDSMIDSGQPVELPRDYVERLKTHYRDMSISNLQALKDAVTNIEHLAKLKYKIKMGQEQRDFDQTMDRAHEFALENNKQTYDPESWEKKNLQKVRDIADDLLASHVKVEALLEQLDGDIEGGDWWTMIFRPLADAENMELEMTAKAGQDMAPIMSRDTFKNLNQKVFINTRMGSMTREQILSMALNWGNAANRDALVRGFKGKMDYNEVRRVLNENLSAEDWQTIQDIWDYINTYWDQIAALQKRLTGVVPEKVEPDQFDTPHGTFKGGYYPLVYDGSKSYRVFKREERQSTEELLSTNFLRPATKKGHTQERVGSGGLPVHLDLSVISQHVSNVIHDLTHREAILQADKVIQDSRTRDAVERIAGRSMYRQLRPWLANIAGGNRQPSTWLESIVGSLRRNTTIVNMGLKFTTAAVQFTGYTQSVELLGEHWAARGLKDFYRHPLKAKAKFKEVMGKSVYMKNRATNFDRDVHDQMAKIKGTSMLKLAQKHYFVHIGYMDLMVTVPTWLGAYEKAHAEGKSETDSIALADRAVRLSQGSGSAKDLAAIQRGSEYQRMFTLFYTYFSSMYNLMRRRVKISGRDGMSPSVFGRGLMSYSYLVIIPAVLSEVITGRFPDDDEDDEENLMEGLKMVGSYPLQSMVGVRDMVSALTTDFGYSMTPVAQAAEAIIQPAGDASDWLDGEFNETDAKHLTMSAGYIFGLPSRQIWITASNLYDMTQGEDLSPSEALMLQEHRD